MAAGGVPQTQAPVGARLGAPLLGDKKQRRQRHKEGLELPPPELEALEPLSSSASRLATVAALFFGLLLGSACALGFVQLLSGPGMPLAPFPAGSMVRLEVHGRGLWVYKPNSSVGQGRLPLVVVLHGSLDTAVNIANASGFSEVAERAERGFLVAFPEMVVERSMNWGYGADYEVRFFGDMVAYLDSQGLIKREEVFVCGHSAGGTMSLFLQNNMPYVFRGAAAVEAGVGHLDQWRNSSFGSPTMVVWNHNDNVLAKYGGEGEYNQTLAFLRRHDPHNEEPASVTHLHTGNSPDVRYADRLLWRGTSKGQVPLMVISWRSERPSHNWLNKRHFGDTSLDAGELIWKFFQATALDAAERRARSGATLHV